MRFYDILEHMLINSSIDRELGLIGTSMATLLLIMSLSLPPLSFEWRAARRRRKMRAHRRQWGERSICTHTLGLSFAYTHTCAPCKYHDTVAGLQLAHGVTLRAHTHTHTYTHTHSVNSMAPVGYTDMHACVTSLYLFGCVRSVHKYSV